MIAFINHYGSLNSFRFSIYKDLRQKYKKRSFT